MCSHMSKVSKVETFLFSKIHFLVRDDKHEIMQVFAGFRNIRVCLVSPWVFWL